MINLVVWFKNYSTRQNYKIVSEIQIDIDEATIKKYLRKAEEAGRLPYIDGILKIKARSCHYKGTGF